MSLTVKPVWLTPVSRIAILLREPRLLLTWRILLSLSYQSQKDLELGSDHEAHLSRLISAHPKIMLPHSVHRSLLTKSQRPHSIRRRPGMMLRVACHA